MMLSAVIVAGSCLNKVSGKPGQMVKPTPHMPFHRVKRKTRIEVPQGRVGDEKGEWLERYVQQIFDAAGFETERDMIVPASTGSAKHEIDVLAGSSEGNIVVECKDMNRIPKIMV
jgi:hypothetical protein